MGAMMIGARRLIEGRDDYRLRDVAPAPRRPSPQHFDGLGVESTLSTFSRRAYFAIRMSLRDFVRSSSRGDSTIADFAYCAATPFSAAAVYY